MSEIVLMSGKSNLLRVSGLKLRGNMN